MEVAGIFLSAWMNCWLLIPPETTVDRLYRRATRVQTVLEAEPHLRLQRRDESEAENLEAKGGAPLVTFPCSDS